MNTQAILRRREEVRNECLSLVPEQATRLKLIRFRVSARLTNCAGKARPTTGEVIMSLPYFADPGNFEQHLRETITHEIAHVLSPPVRLPGQKNRSSHGPAWRAMHSRLGGKGERCHALNLAVGFTRRRKAQRVEANCHKCGGIIMLGPTQAKRAIQGGARYSHRVCPR